VQRFCAVLEDPVTRDSLIELGFNISPGPLSGSDA
jgi:hypothetical protein